MGKKSKGRGYRKSNVVDFPGLTTLALNPKKMLMKIAEENPDNCIIICKFSNGVSFHSSFADTEENDSMIVRLLEELKIRLLMNDFGD